MIRLKDGLLLYHGSYMAIPHIRLEKCVSGLDFGKGYYVTPSYEQAFNYVPLAVKKNIRRGVVKKNFNISDGRVSIYRYHSNPNLLTHYFDEADADWLHFVTANRNFKLFPDLFAKLKYIDIIGGKIADDNTASTLNAYMMGLYGTSGSLEADTFAIQQLLPERLEPQFCFCTPEAVQSLEYIGSEGYGTTD